MPAKWIPKLYQGKREQVQRMPCPAWPTIGETTGATWEWCQVAKGEMAACARCPWGGKVVQLERDRRAL